MNQRLAILSLRIIAVLVPAVAVVAFIAQARMAASGVPVQLIAAMLALAVGLAATLFGIARLLQQQPREIEGLRPSPTAAEGRLVELAIKLEDLKLAVEQLAQAYAAPSDDLQAVQEPGGQSQILVTQQKLFEDLRELTLLPDEQRRQRWQDHRTQRKEAAIQTASAFIHARQWGDAQRWIDQIESEWPDDPAIEAIRKELQSARSSEAKEAIADARAQIESEMSLSNWDQALARARNLAADFPASATAAKLLERVERERSIYTETSVQRLYDEIRHDVERRIWRRALEHAQRLLERFPDHSRSELVRKQIKTIQENAEIEERQEQETRIGELIRARRFSEAVDLSQELLARFPSSPQAIAIEKMLPRIQQLAADAESPSPLSGQ